MATLLLLGASVSQLAAIRQARAQGLRVVAVDGDPDAVGLAEADVAEPCDFSDVEAVVELARRHRVDGVVAISTDRAVPTAAAVADRLGLPGIGPAVARAMTDKAAMRRELARQGLPQPRFAVIDAADAASAAAALERVGVPAVLKPADSGGQRGVFRVADEAELAARLPQTLAFSRSGRAILERFLDGDELNVIAVARAGEVRVLTLSDRLRPPGVGFGVGWIHRYPSQLPAALLDQAARLAADAVAALGLRDGIAFPQLLAADGRLFVVEVAARVPAGQMADLVREAIGVDLISIAIETALGRPTSEQALAGHPPRPIVIGFFTAEPGVLPTGRLLSLSGLEHVRAAPGVIDAGLYLQPGETIQPVQVDADRRGYVIATGDTTDDALAAAQQAMRQLVVTTDRTTAPTAAER